MPRLGQIMTGLDAGELLQFFGIQFALSVRIQAESQDDLPAYLSLHHRALVLSKGDMVQPPTICSAVDGAKALRWGD